MWCSPLLSLRFPLSELNARALFRLMSCWALHCHLICWPESQLIVWTGSLWMEERHLRVPVFIRNQSSLHIHCCRTESRLHVFNSTPPSAESSKHRSSLMLWIVKLNVPWKKDYICETLWLNHTNHTFISGKWEWMGILSRTWYNSTVNILFLWDYMVCSSPWISQK